MGKIQVHIKKEIIYFSDLSMQNSQPDMVHLKLQRKIFSYHKFISPRGQQASWFPLMGGNEIASPSGMEKSLGGLCWFRRKPRSFFKLLLLLRLDSRREPSWLQAWSCFVALWMALSTNLLLPCPFSQDLYTPKTEKRKLNVCRVPQCEKRKTVYFRWCCMRFKAAARDWFAPTKF